MDTDSGISVPNQTIFQKLFLPVDNSPLIFFRIVFGFLMAYNFLAMLLNGAIYNLYIRPPFTFNFIGFDFLQPLPGIGMYIYVGIMVILAIMIMLGAWYRLAIIFFTILWTILYLMQKSGYNNHYYLMLLLCFIMIFMPANRDCSFDIKRHPALKSKSCSQYCLWIIMAQIAIVYFFAATSKLTSDWFSGKFIAIQFSNLSKHPKLGLMYGQHWFQSLICYGGFLFDLLIVPLLLWKRTRNYAFILACFFHLFNAFTFRIGIFPFLSIALSLFFLDSKYASKLLFRNRSAEAVNDFKVNLTIDSFKKKMIITCLAVYIFFQLLIPMRSFLFPGNVFWNEEGYRMSWKMMMRTKSGTVYFKVVDPDSNETWKIDPAKSFTPDHLMWLSISPDIIWQYAQRIKKDFVVKGFPHAHVYAIGAVSLNRSEPKPLVDTTVDLAAVKWNPYKHSTWITDF